jgi:rod shape-determining protein MreC
MLRFSIQARQVLAKLSLPALIAAAFGLMLLGKADALLVERARMILADALTPIYATLASPLHELRDTVTDATDLWAIRRENTRLREENDRLRRWQSIAVALDAENQRLKANLHWIPDHAPSFVTARIIADAGGIYARAVLASVGPNHDVHKGEIALDERGLVGRITEVGTRSARVLLITDLNSRIPVILGNSRAHAILTGTNGPRPRLLYWPEETPPQEAERVITGTEAGALPANLAVGTVHFTSANVPEVIPAAMLDRLEIIRIFDYGLGGLPPEAPARVVERPER